MSKIKVAVLGGDGIGPEVVDVTIEILEKILPDYFDYCHALVGGAAIDQKGHALPKETLQVCEEADAILFGSVGGPKWEGLPPDKQPERAALLPLRKHFNLYANIRPVIIFPELKDASPLKPEIVARNVDLIILRELTGGIYFGQPKGRLTQGQQEKAFDTLVYQDYEIERIARLAFEMALSRKKLVHSIDKANVLTSMVFWREIVEKVHQDFPDVTLKHMYVDNAAMQLIREPSQFDIVLCGNMFGDILSDEASQITGSIGMLPSASLGKKNSQGHYFGLYEPSGGSAPDIAGLGIANPVAQILSAAMMLRSSFGLFDEAARIENAIRLTLKEGYRTRDIAYQTTDQVCNTQQMKEKILQFLQ